MAEQSGSEVKQKFHSHNSIFPNEKVDLMREIAPRFGIKINTLAKEGEKYSPGFDDRLATHVPKDSSYVMVSATNKSGFDDFYNAVRTAEKAKQSSVDSSKV